MESEQRQLKEHVDEYRNLERNAQQELVDVDKDFDKMASKESIYLEKSVCSQMKYKLVTLIYVFSMTQERNFVTLVQFHQI